jgi:hypothetical protein
MPRVAKTFNGNLEQALAANQDHLFIGNNLKNRGILIFEVKDSSGKSVGIKLPKTWVPIDLMLFVDRESIKRSNNIRTLHRKGAIKFLDPTDSIEILKTEEAKKEAERAGLFNSFESEDFSNDSNQAAVKEVADNSSNDDEYYGNIINEIKGLQQDGESEDVIINKIKDMQSSYFSDPDGIDKGKLILQLTDIKSFLSDAGKANASVEVDSFLSSIKD